MRLINTLLFALTTMSVMAATKTYNFTVGWVDADPDGETTRKVIGINGEFPLPIIEVDKGDRVLVYMQNDLGGDTGASIHFHGLYQNGTNYMDGPAGVTQCSVAPGGSILYNFTVDQNGTYWYHTHVGGTYPDGYRGLIIVHDKNWLDEVEYEEVWLTLSDWYHELTSTLNIHFLSVYNPSGAEPVPDSMLFNDTTNVSIPVEPGKTYLFRIANIGAFSSQYFWIEDHDMTVVETDGVYTDPYTVSNEALYIAVAQRYSILVTMKNQTERNYGIVTAFDQDLFDVIDPSLGLNMTNNLQYNASAPWPEVDLSEYETSDDIPMFDDFSLVPADHKGIFENPSKSVTVQIEMINLDNGAVYAFLNNVTWVSPKVPTLYTAIQAGNYSSEPYIYGSSTHTTVLDHLDVVEVILNNDDSGTHPFHLHGHEFQVIYRGEAADDFTPYNGSTDFPDIPSRRDTVYVRPYSSVVIRWVADNPGAWFFHCHIDWHLTQGLGMIFLEAPELLAGTEIPQDHIDACKYSGLAYEGNAAGNANLFDLSGQNLPHGALPDGFTARGIVALVFSCISAFLGFAAISWYGLSDLSNTTAHMIQEVEEETGEPIDDADPSNMNEPMHRAHI